MSSVVTPVTRGVEYTVDLSGKISFFEELGPSIKNAIIYHEGLDEKGHDVCYKGPTWKTSLDMVVSKRVTKELVTHKSAEKLYRIALLHFQEAYEGLDGGTHSVYEGLKDLLKSFRLDSNIQTKNPQLHLIQAASCMGDLHTVSSILFPRSKQTKLTKPVAHLLENKMDPLSPLFFAITRGHKQVLSQFITYYSSTMKSSEFNRLIKRLSTNSQKLQESLSSEEERQVIGKSVELLKEKNRRIERERSFVNSCALRRQINLMKSAVK